MENAEERKEVKKSGKLKKFLIIIILLGCGLFAYVRFVGTSDFIVKEYPVYSDKLPSNFNGLKIVQISDIHYGSLNKGKLDSVVAEINKIKPDIVVFTGDLYDEFSTLTDDAKNEMINSLSKIDTKLGKYSVKGNHDYSQDGYEEIMEKSGFINLYNSSKIIYYNGTDPIEIVGYPSYIMENPNYDYQVSDYYKIGLIHEPDAIDNIIDKDFNLVLAGHSHGGQVRLPIIGDVYEPPGSKKYHDEYYKVNNTDLYVSYGLGEVMWNVRFFDRPSINLYRLYSNN